MKRESVSNQRDRDTWLETMLRRSPVTSSDVCPDAEALAAWTNGTLRVNEADAVELHASSCSRCMAVLAAMERTAPATPTTRHGWMPGSLFRWLVPLTAAATAVAIWIAVPDRQTTMVQPMPAHEAASGVAPRAEPVEPSPPDTQDRRAANVPDPNALQSKSVPQPAPSARIEKPEELQEGRLRDEMRTERAAAEALDAPAAAPAPPPSAPRAEAAGAPSAAADLTKRADATFAQSAASRTAVGTESIAPSDSSIRWRVVSRQSVERSTDEGKTWTATAPPPGIVPDSPPALTVVGVRAVDALRAVVRMSDGTEFYTIDGGRAWTRVQGNAAAPF